MLSTSNTLDFGGKKQLSRFEKDDVTTSSTTRLRVLALILIHLAFALADVDDSRVVEGER
jgi:hypothetical protein